jgi:hypothetical protein
MCHLQELYRGARSTEHKMYSAIFFRNYLPVYFLVQTNGRR